MMRPVIDCNHIWLGNSGKGGELKPEQPTVRVKCSLCGATTLMSLHQFCAHLLDMIERQKTYIKTINDINQDTTVANQAAWIEWRHGKGAKAGMQWIENGLVGPGLIPDPSGPYGKEAQAYFDTNKSDPFPKCFCGRPSHILWMGHGACCSEHMKTTEDKWKSDSTVPASKRMH